MMRVFSILALILCCHLALAVFGSLAGDTKYASSESRSAESGADLTLRAFCRTSMISDPNFPLKVPERHTPWVWDALYDSTIDLVEVTLMPSTACIFNHTLWRMLVNTHPQYSAELAYGDGSKILVNASYEDFDSTGRRKPRQGLLGKTLKCVFYNDDSNKRVGESLSQPMRHDGNVAAFSTMQVYCKAPTASSTVRWNSMALERLDIDVLIEKGDAPPSAERSTERFPVCTVPRYRPQEKRYNMSVCTATASMRADTTMEWIEFHKLQGVDHFYIYSTSTDPSESKRFRDILSDYIEQKIVTFVEWPYQNCVKGFASGRVVHWDPPGGKGWYILLPPKPIAQTGALASCYSRFRHTTKYITHIDLDEFIFVGAQHGKSKPLLAFTEKIFNLHPESPAYFIDPVMMQDCTNRQIKNTHADKEAHINSPLPRLGQLNYAIPATKYEHKAVMRTDAVNMFFIHYISFFNDTANKDFTETNLFYPHRKHIAMFHYKSWETQDDHTVYGKLLPYKNEVHIRETCLESTFLNVFDKSPPLLTLSNAERNGFTHHRVASSDSRSVRQMYNNYRHMVERAINRSIMLSNNS